MTLVGILSVGAFLRDGVLNTLPICHFTVYTKSAMKYAYNKFFFIDKIKILTPSFILIDSKYDKTFMFMNLRLYSNVFNRIVYK